LACFLSPRVLRSPLLPLLHPLLLSACLPVYLALRASQTRERERRDGRGKGERWRRDERDGREGERGKREKR